MSNPDLPICSNCGQPYKKGNKHFKLCFKCNNERLHGSKFKNDTNIPKPKLRALNVKKTTFKDISEVKVVVKQSKAKQSYKSLREFFLEIWGEREHKCNRCGKHLGEEPLAHFFSHIYPKSIKPELKFEKSNIELLCFECHQEHDFGKREINLGINKIK